MLRSAGRNQACCNSLPLQPCSHLDAFIPCRRLLAAAAAACSAAAAAAGACARCCTPPPPLPPSRAPCRAASASEAVAADRTQRRINQTYRAWRHAGALRKEYHFGTRSLASELARVSFPGGCDERDAGMCWAASWSGASLGSPAKWFCAALEGAAGAQGNTVAAKESGLLQGEPQDLCYSELAGRRPRAVCIIRWRPLGVAHGPFQEAQAHPVRWRACQFSYLNSHTIFLQRPANLAAEHTLAHSSGVLVLDGVRKVGVMYAGFVCNFQNCPSLREAAGTACQTWCCYCRVRSAWKSRNPPHEVDRNWLAL